MLDQEPGCSSGCSNLNFIAISKHGLDYRRFDSVNAHHRVQIYTPNILWCIKNIFTGDLKYSILNILAKGATVTWLNRVFTVLTENHSIMRFLQSLRYLDSQLFAVVAVRIIFWGVIETWLLTSSITNEPNIHVVFFLLELLNTTF